MRVTAAERIVQQRLGRYFASPEAVAAVTADVIAGLTEGGALKRRRTPEAQEQHRAYMRGYMANKRARQTANAAPAG